MSASNPPIGFKQTAHLFLHSAEVGKNSKSHEEVPTWDKLGRRAVLLAEADTGAWILNKVRVEADFFVSTCDQLNAVNVTGWSWEVLTV